MQLEMLSKDKYKYKHKQKHKNTSRSQSGDGGVYKVSNSNAGKVGVKINATSTTSRVMMKMKGCEVCRSHAFGLGIYAFLSVMREHRGFYGCGVTFLEHEYADALLQVADDDKKIAAIKNKIVAEVIWE